MRLLIAIPVHNERNYVDQVLDKVLRFHADVLVVDDGSTDGTAEVLATPVVVCRATGTCVVPKEKQRILR